MRQITDIDEGTIRRVDWQELIPLTIFFRAFSATFKTSFLALGALLFAILATFAGFQQQAPQNLGCDKQEKQETVLLNSGSGETIGLFCPLTYEWRVETSSQASIFSTSFLQSPPTGIAFLPTAIVTGLVSLWFALALSRTTVVRLTSSARSSTFASLVFATKKFRSLLLPLVFIAVLTIGLWGFELIVAKTNVLGQICAPIVVLVNFGFVAVIFLLGLAFPLSVTAIAAENSDGFDATSRGISYLTQRPFFWILYYAVAFVFVILGLAIVETLANVCLTLFDEVYMVRDGIGGWLRFWRFTILATPLVYCCNAVVVYTNAIYILLRRSVDGTTFDSCVLDLTKRKPRQLRQILQDGKGAPQFDTTPKENSKPDEESKDA